MYKSQLYEADRSKEWFVVAAMFMGEIILKTIPYYRLVILRSSFNKNKKIYRYKLR
jgi:hypothetical protein